MSHLANACDVSLSDGYDVEDRALRVAEPLQQNARHSHQPPHALLERQSAGDVHDLVRRGNIVATALAEKDF